MRSRRAFLSTLLCGSKLLRSSPASNTYPHFVDIARQAGLTAKTVIGGEAKKAFILESTGGGVALLDYDNDGWLDIFLVNGSQMENIPGVEKPTNHLYRNNRDGTFTDVTSKAGLIRHGWGQGVCAGDYDNDGHCDLFVTYYGQNVLYRNRGNGAFADATEAAGLLSSKRRYCTGAAFVDYDRDGKLDLFVTSYIAYDEAVSHPAERETGCQWKGLKTFCGPRGLKAGCCFLYHNNGDGTFTDVSEPAGITKAGLAYGFTPLVFDYDNDGWPDIYVACDSSRSLLFQNQRNGTFKEVGTMAGVAYNEDGREQAGMGVSAGDYDGDGWLDIVKTNFADDTTTLYRNSGNGSFNDATFAGHLGVNTNFLGWGTGLVDLDDDGWPDIFIANGHVYPEVQKQPVDATYAQRKLVYRNCRNGAFEDISLRSGPGVLVPKVSRGVAFGDLFNTGQVDIVVNNMNDTPTILRDMTPRVNRALRIGLVGERSNRSAIGTRVELEAGGHRSIDEVRSGGSFCSQNDFYLHFGLGTSQRAERILIRWPSGKIESFANVPGGQCIVVKEGQGVVSARPFGMTMPHASQ